nr:putative jacalin-like lectin domain-containing protein [Tanacetum cinerariifolium]
MASIQELDHLKIPLEDIKLATNNFSHTSFIGQGGFGRVYKGQLRISSSKTTNVAVKRIAYQCLEMDRKRRPAMALIMEQLQISLELQIGCRRMTRIGLWGSSTGGSPWTLQLGSNQKLRKITIDHEDWIYSIVFTTEEFGGLLDSSQHHGGGGGKSGGKISEINFDANEEITGILGTVGVTTGRYAGYTVISSLCFMTNKTRHGPFGKETGTPFSVPWELDINLATNNFSKDNFIGKQLDMNISGQREFLIEIVMLASYKHNNLVSLVGFRDEDGEKIISYKHEVHGSLDKYLASTDITWDQRLRICLGAAHGLEYLHNGVGVGMGHKIGEKRPRWRKKENGWITCGKGNRIRDTWRGTLQEDGKFTVNTLTKMMEERLFTFESHGQETIWNKWIPKKVNIFVWRALKGRIPVRARLDKRDIDLDSILCPCCGNL